jgi:DNA-damage-inducible protein J
MSANALVQTRIDPEIRDKASEVLHSMGMAVSDAVRILLTRTANEGVLPLELIGNAAAHDAWFRRKVQEVLDDVRPAIPHQDVEVRFAAKRTASLRKAAASE